MPISMRASLPCALMLLLTTTTTAAIAAGTSTPARHAARNLLVNP